jgi:hypothetical protein
LIRRLNQQKTEYARVRAASNVKDNPGFNTSIYAEDVKDVGGGDPRAKYRPAEVKGSLYRFPVNPGKRPKRKPGESPLDPRSE